ncbi:hypothetical protein [Fontibacillus panacisegetis]|uniref:hypothetical protein n=1 Tax=Fontibacillus panacisegetis TaxID=670482 RepID=UPI000B82EC42|nr:hypothetical protein [Fontibacillus panacisegetis]
MSVLWVFVSINGLLVKKNKPYIVSWKLFAKVIALVAIITEAPGKVLEIGFSSKGGTVTRSAFIVFTRHKQ